MKRLIPLVLTLACLLATDVMAEFYRYTDEAGNPVFVDDLSKVPPERLESLKSYREPLDGLSEADRKQRREAAEKARQARRKKTAPPESGPVETAVTIRGNQVFVPVTLGHGPHRVETTLLLDTGASITAIHRDVAEQLYLPAYRRVQARTADGTIIEARIITLESLTVGPFQRRDLTVGIIDHQAPQVPYRGLLGMNFLRDFNYAVDVRRGVIRWLP